MDTKTTTSLVIFVAFYIIFFSQGCTCHDCPKPLSPPPPPPPLRTPMPTPPPPTPIPVSTCPTNVLNLRVCANLLNIIGVSIGSPQACCSLIEGLLDLEAAVCLCTAIKANILGVILNIRASLNLILNQCGKKVPKGFHCA